MQPCSRTLSMAVVAALFAVSPAASQQSPEPAGREAVEPAQVFSGVEEPDLPPDQRLATVYVYRSRDEITLRKPPVYCDEIELARISSGRYFVARVASGPHRFRSSHEGSAVELELRPGHEYYIEVLWVRAFPIARVSVEPVPPEVGANDIQVLAPLPGEAIKDHSIVMTNATFPHKGFFGPGEVPGHSVTGDAFSRLEPRTRVRVTRMMVRHKEWVPETLEGTFLSVGEDGALKVRVNSDKEPILVEPTSVTKLEVNVGRVNRAKAALEGAGVGFGLAGLLVALPCSKGGPAYLFGQYGCTEKGFVTIAAATSVTGALIGLALPGPRWVEVPKGRVRLGFAPTRGRGAAAALSIEF